MRYNSQLNFIQRWRRAHLNLKLTNQVNIRIIDKFIVLNLSNMNMHDKFIVHIPKHKYDTIFVLNKRYKRETNPDNGFIWFGKWDLHSPDNITNLNKSKRL